MTAFGPDFDWTKVSVQPSAQVDRGPTVRRAVNAVTWTGDWIRDPRDRRRQDLAETMVQ